MIDVKIKKLHSNAVIPSYAKPGDAGMDLVATEIKWPKDNANYIQYNTGLAIEIPEGYVGLIFPRSSNSGYDLQLCNAVGVIDSGYRGEICLRYRVVLLPTGDKPRFYEVGDRVGQLMIVPYPLINFIETSMLSETDRGQGGFGSSGR